jgi:hypothetical protein
MGLRLKCPGCQATNPLSLRVCPVCGRSLDNLPPEQRVYVIEPLGTPSPKPSSPSPKTASAKPKAAAAPPSAEAPPKAARKPPRPRKKQG